MMYISSREHSATLMRLDFQPSDFTPVLRQSWMFESTAAWLLNRVLGKYVQDLDSEQLNVGVFSGEVRLTDLRLKPEALF
ncbi:hypothetical protein B566_EDAN017051 [Ephemera danica]|nr:hypothetical protein B566_EDAN017051 [Ephemera danica]